LVPLLREPVDLIKAFCRLGLSSLQQHLWVIGCNCLTLSVHSGPWCPPTRTRSPLPTRLELTVQQTGRLSVHFFSAATGKPIIAKPQM